MQIEKNIPIPSPSRRGRASKYPFADMQPGDSFEVEVRQSAVRAAAHNYARAHNARAKFICRTLPTGTRCWRVE